ncbi:hypothetical protein EV368DRAFT_77527 [Lentinula lateritia]|nr:hypothetical protein EV368DRAFT_77527 [Lentinula lateritia]
MQRVQAVSRLVAQRSHGSSTWHRLNSSLATKQPFVPLPPRLAPRKPRDAAEARVGYDGSPNSVRVHFWHAPRDSADVLAAVQYIEQLYGPIDEFNCPSVTTDRKATTLFIRFRDQGSAARAQAVVGSHRIPVPEIPRPVPIEGGMSLASLESILSVKPHQAELEPDLSEPDPAIKYDHSRDVYREFLYIQIRDACNAPAKKREHYLSRAAMRAFIGWAGFTDIKPLPQGTPILEQGDAVDHPLMRHAVSNYAGFLRMRNPLELPPVPTSNPATVGSPSTPSEKVEVQADSTNAVASDLPISTTSDTFKEVTPIPSAEPVFDPLVTPTSDPSPLPISTVSNPTPTPKPAPAPSQLAKSPEAIAQLRMANSILKKIHKPKKAKMQAHSQSGTKNLTPGAPPQKPQRPQKHASPSVQSGEAQSGEHPVSVAVDGKAVDTSKNNATSKLRGFMGNWF